MLPVDLFKLLSDQTRLSIVLLVAHHGELCVCELTDVLQLSQPKVSRHLAILRNGGLLEGEKRGQWVYYRLHHDLPVSARQLIACTLECYPASLPRLPAAKCSEAMA